MSIESASSHNNFDYEEYENLSDVASTATQPDEEEAAVAASAATRPISQEDSSVPVLTALTSRSYSLLRRTQQRSALNLW